MATVMSWAGMRGVVTLAAALSLPVAFPGRDIVLVSAFAVILVTGSRSRKTRSCISPLLKSLIYSRWLRKDLSVDFVPVTGGPSRIIPGAGNAFSVSPAYRAHRVRPH